MLNYFNASRYDLPLTVGTTLGVVKIDVNPLCSIWVVVKCLLCATRLITVDYLLISKQH